MDRGISVAEDAPVALIPEVAVKLPAGDGRIPLPDNVAGLVGHELPDVRAYIPAAEGVEIPVRFHGGDLAVVVVIVRIFRTDELCR